MNTIQFVCQTVNNSSVSMYVPAEMFVEVGETLESYDYITSYAVVAPDIAITTEDRQVIDEWKKLESNNGTNEGDSSN